jgi:ubiquinone/menaquinone biosynthesis C-methylase UbiE
MEKNEMSNTASVTLNYWPDSACARAFWGQQELPPYQQLLADTSAWLLPRAGERWLDLGCGCGKLTEALWQNSNGTVGEIVGLDCAGDNALAFQQLRSRVRPNDADERIRFVHADFSSGLRSWEGGRFDGIVSGLAIQYAESYSQELRQWTTHAYDRLLADVHRLLRAGGSFVFSVNVPEPSFFKVALYSIWGAFDARRTVRYTERAFRMWRYGAWLKQEARKGRFHYLPLPTVIRKLKDCGFADIDHRLTFAGTAYLIRCRKPLAKMVVRERSRPARRNGRSRFATVGAERASSQLATSAF